MAYAHYKRTREPSIIRTIEDIQLHKRLIPAFRVIKSKAAIDGLIDPLSVSIIEGVSLLAFVPCVILSVYLCRFSELQFLSMKKIRNAKTISIPQPKTKTVKRASSQLFRDVLQDSDVSDKVEMRVISYVQLAKEIRRSAVRAGITLPDKTKGETHIFRHLYASWAKMKGLSDESTAKRLGHSSLDALVSYQHPWHAMKSLQIK